MAKWDNALLVRNWAAPETGLGFWVIFAIFFPAVTGFTQGVSMSGDLKDAGKSLPLGTFIAVGVSIVVYSDPDRTEDVASGTTNSSGQATCTLPDGTYYYTATKASYVDLLGDFTVSGGPLTESFQMLSNVYTVTFDETHGLEGVSIVIYSDSERIEDVASGTTNSSGQATLTVTSGSLATR